MPGQAAGGGLDHWHQDVRDQPRGKAADSEHDDADFPGAERQAQPIESQRLNRGKRSRDQAVSRAQAGGGQAQAEEQFTPRTANLLISNAFAVKKTTARRP